MAQIPQYAGLVKIAVICDSLPSFRLEKMEYEADSAFKQWHPLWVLESVNIRNLQENMRSSRNYIYQNEPIAHATTNRK